MTAAVSNKTRTMPAVKHFTFTSTVVSTVQRWFQDAGRRGIEDVAIGTGFPTADGDAIVASALHPDAARALGWYEQRLGPAWDQLYQFGFQHRTYYLAQLHTHPPGYGTRHSYADDIGAFCDRIGFISIVVPDFALRGVDLLADDVTIHERTRDGWRIWPHAEALERIRVLPVELDLQTLTIQENDDELRSGR